MSWPRVTTWSGANSVALTPTAMPFSCAQPMARAKSWSAATSIKVASCAAGSLSIQCRMAISWPRVSGSSAASSTGRPARGTSSSSISVTPGSSGMPGTSGVVGGVTGGVGSSGCSGCSGSFSSHTASNVMGPVTVRVSPAGSPSTVQPINVQPSFSPGFRVLRSISLPFSTSVSTLPSLSTSWKYSSWAALRTSPLM